MQVCSEDDYARCLLLETHSREKKAQAAQVEKSLSSSGIPVNTVVLTCNYISEESLSNPASEQLHSK